MSGPQERAWGQVSLHSTCPLVFAPRARRGKTASTHGFLQHLTDLLWIGAPAGGFHHLADQGVEGFVLAGAVFLDALRVGSEHGVDGGLQCGAVVDLRQSAGVDDGVDIAALLARPQRGEDFLGGLARQGAVVDFAGERGELRGAHGAGADVALVAVELSGEFAHDPVGCEFGRGACGHAGLEVGGVGAGLGHLRRGIQAQAVGCDEARGHLAGKLGHVGAHPLDPLGRDDQRRQVGVGEVAVIVRVFLGAHGAGLALVGVVKPGFLHHLAAVFDEFDLAAHLEFDGFFEEAKAVEVFDFAARAQGFAGAAHRDVGVAAKRPFLQIAVADVQPHDQRVQGAGVFGGFAGAAHVGLGDDFEQRRARAVEVDAAGGVARAVEQPGFVQRLARVLFEVGAGELQAVRFAVHQKLDHPALHHGNLVLADLVALGQVRVEVVLAREDGARRDGGAQSQTEADGAFHRSAVGHRQHAGQR